MTNRETPFLRFSGLKAVDGHPNLSRLSVHSLHQRGRAGDWRNDRMHLGKVALAATAAASFVTGAIYQSPRQNSLPLQYFSHAKAEDFVGDAKCAECHELASKAFPQSPHAIHVHNTSLAVDKQGCESCHGPGKEHVGDAQLGKQILAYPKLRPGEVVDACLRCHGDLMKKSHFSSESHARAGLSCVSCHQIHPKLEEKNPVKGERSVVKKAIFAAAKDSNPLLKFDEATLCNTCHKPELAAFRKNSHHPIPEGRMVCSDCHSIHPTNADRMKVGTVKEKCVTCHADIAGPFTYEHDPVAGWTGGSCAECHNPHGSHNPKLLTASSRGLCAQCHTDKGGASHFPGQTCWTAGCHVAIHGSNHDSRFLVK